MKKRGTALLLAMAMLSALVIGALADEQDKDAAAQETAQTTPDAAGTLSFENLGDRMKAGSYSLLALEENIALIESTDYEKVEDDLREALNQIAETQWNMAQLGNLGSLAGDQGSGAAIGTLGNTVGLLGSQSLQSNYDALKKQFDAVRDGDLQADNADLVRQLRNTEDTVVMMGQSLYVTLLDLTAQSAALARQDAALDRTIEEMELRYQLGQISAMTLQQVKAGKTQLESGKATLDMNIAALRRQLNSMVGEELTANLSLQKLPVVTSEQLAAMDLEKDLEKAKAASYELYDAKKTLDDADEAYEDSGARDNYVATNYKKVQARHTWQAAQYTYNATVQSYELSFRSLYDSVKDCAQILTSAQTSLAVKRADLETAQLKYDQGSISENALHTAEDDLYAAQDTVTGAEHDLFTAYNNYRWAVEYGLINS